MGPQITLNFTLIIIGVTTFVSIHALNHRELYERWLYSPYMVAHRKQYERIFTHALLHADAIHLIFNMYVLLMFNQDYGAHFGVESSYRHRFGILYVPAYLGLYVGAILVSSIPAFLKHRDNPAYGAIGASGAVSGIVFSYMLFYPTQEMGLLFIPGLRIPAFIFGPAYLLFESFLSRRGKSRIGHDAHIWGGIFGFVFTSLLNHELLLNFLHQANEYIRSFF